MALIITNDGFGCQYGCNFFVKGQGTAENPYYWSIEYNSYAVQAISFTNNQKGKIYIEYDSGYFQYSISNLYVNTSLQPGMVIEKYSPRILNVSDAIYNGYIFFYYGWYGYVKGLKIWFVADSGITTSTTTSTTTQQPSIGSKVFIHVGNINVPDDNCGRYKLTLDGSHADYFTIYGKRLYLTTYPQNSGNYNVNVCAKDPANRFTPLCKPFNLLVKKCVFTTEPPTTTPAPNFGYVQSENSVSTVHEYTYNKIYGLKKK